MNTPIDVDTFNVELTWRDIQRSTSALIAMVSASAMIAIGLIALMSR